MYLEMSTLQSPVLNMSARMSKNPVGLVEIKITMFSKRKNSREKKRIVADHFCLNLSVANIFMYFFANKNYKCTLRDICHELSKQPSEFTLNWLIA